MVDKIRFLIYNIHNIDAISSLIISFYFRESMFGENTHKIF